MILWDIASGERLRTFEGHDRGLACIEFKVFFFLNELILFPNLFFIERSHRIWL